MRPAACILPALLVASLNSLGCSKTDSAPQPASSGTTIPLSPIGTTAIVGSNTDAAAPATTGTAGAGAPAAADYTGTYKATAGTLYVPEEKDWKGFRFRGDDAGTGLGDGTLTLKVKEGGRIEGEGEGAFGKFILSGFLAENTLSAAIMRKDPTDDGFTGFLIGTKKGEAFEGTMKLSLARGNVLRDATFTVKK